MRDSKRLSMRGASVSEKRLTELDMMSLTTIYYVFGEGNSIPIDIRKMAETLTSRTVPVEIICSDLKTKENPCGEPYKFEEEGKLACLIGSILAGNLKFRKRVLPDDWKPSKRGPKDVEMLYFAEGLLLPWRMLCPFIADERCFDPDVVSDTFMAPKDWVLRRMAYIFSDWRMIGHLNDSFFDELKSPYKEDVEREK